MALPRHLVDEVRSRADIVSIVERTVTLRRSGRSYSGLCPFHNEKTPSFSVVPDKGIFHCFGCGESGDVFGFLMKTRGVSFFEAVKELGDAAGIVVEEREMTPQERQRLQQRADLHDVTELTALFYTDLLLVSPDGAPGRDYLAARGITLETAQKYRLGYAPDAWDRLTGHLQAQRIPSPLALAARVVGKSERSERVYDLFRHRLMFPILDDRGRVVAFGGRLLPRAADPRSPDGDARAASGAPPKTDGPKYLNSPESEIYNKSKTLYGLSWARMPVQRKDRALLVEGYFDAVSLWQAGFEEAVATCGTALTEAHLEVLKRLTRKVVALFDGDEAGLKAAAKSMELFLDAGVEARRLELGTEKDPDEFIQKRGAEAFEQLLQRTEPLVELVVRRTIQREGSSAEGRARALEALVPILRRLPETVRLQAASRAAGLLGMHEAVVLGRLAPSDTAPRSTPEGPRASSAAPPRWVPSRELAHLLWLLLHFPETVAPLLAAADPDLITDRLTVLEAIVALASGARLAEVIDGGQDLDLARALRAIAAKPDEYKEEQAESATRSLLARLESTRLETEILTLNARIAACETSGDKSSYLSLAKEVATLYARQQTLKSIVARRSPRG